MRKLLLAFLFFSFSDLFGCSEGIEGDLELSKKIPLISGLEEDAIIAIIKGDKAAITVCKTSLVSSLFIPYDHVFLAFEIKNPCSYGDEILLFSVHFTAGNPDIVDAGKTLVNLYRGKKTYLYSPELEDKNIEPISSREVVFIVENSKAMSAIKFVENNNKLDYRLFGGDSEDSYNCCTYSDRILREAGIKTEFIDNYWVRNAANFIECCKNCETTTEQKRITEIKAFDYERKSFPDL